LCARAVAQALGLVPDSEVVPYEVAGAR